MLWVTASAVLWLTLVVTVIAICRAASIGDAVEEELSGGERLDPLTRFSRTAAPLPARRRSHIA